MTETEQDRSDMRRLQAGESAALDPLMERWQIRLRSYVMRHGFSDPDSCDLAQETFVRVFRHADRFDPQRIFSTWMFQITLNLLRDRARQNSRRPQVAWDEAPETTDGTSPQSEVEAQERAAAVRTAITQLPDNLREVVILAEFQHLPHAEIAEIIGASSKAVETRLYRAREKLRQDLSRWLQS